MNILSYIFLFFVFLSFLPTATFQYPSKQTDNLFAVFESLKQCAYFPVMNPYFRIDWIYDRGNWIFNGIMNNY